MPDFPRQWQYFANAVGGAAPPSITLPAIVNVSHVLTSIVAQIENFTASGYGPVVAVTFGATVVWQGLCNSAPDTGAGAQDGSLSWTGSLAAAPNTAATVSFSVIEASVTEWLTIQGYDF